MGTTFHITSENTPQAFQDVGFKDGATSYSFDLSQWAEDNGTVTTVTWTVKSGSATISGEALASNVATALITFGQSGSNLIQIKASTGSKIYIGYLDVLAKDPQGGTYDYGMVR